MMWIRRKLDENRTSVEVDTMRFSLLKFALVPFFLVLTVQAAAAPGEDFRILSWNVESNRPGQDPVSDPVTIAAELKTLAQTAETKFGILVLSECAPGSMEIFRAAVEGGLGKQVDYVSSASGGFADSDSLMLLVDTTQFEIVDAMELHRFGGIKGNFNNPADASDPGALRARSPLAVRLLSKARNKSFWVVANHLARGEADLRTEQAKMLRMWADTSREPVITAGDFNFDYEFKTQKGNAGFDAMMEGGTWQWLKPDPLIDSNWSDDRRVTDRRVDRYPDSILDFVFVANEAKSWNGVSRVIVRPNDFPDTEKTSDHRPLITGFSVK